MLFNIVEYFLVDNIYQVSDAGFKGYKLAGNSERKKVVWPGMERIHKGRKLSKLWLYSCYVLLSCVKVAATFTLPNWGYFQGVEAILYWFPTKHGLKKGQEIPNKP